MLSNGTLDTSFGDNGKIITNIGSRDGINDVCIQQNGKILALGYSHLNSDNFFVLARYNYNGSMDTTFAKNGIKTINIGYSYAHANTVLEQDNGKIILAGEKDYKIILMGFSSDGTVDQSFGVNGTMATGAARRTFPFSCFSNRW